MPFSAIIIIKERLGFVLSIYVKTTDNMKAIFQCCEYEVLSMDGLRYETGFNRIYDASKNTHIPVFDQEGDMYIQVGREVLRFIPKLIRYAFRYYDNDGNLSQPFTAIICELEGQETDCVILARYAQSQADDYWESLGPYDDVPCGRWDFWSVKPDIFFADRERTRRLSYSLLRVKTPGETFGYDDDGNPLIRAYRYNPDENKIESVPVDVQEICYEPNGGLKNIRAIDIDEGRAFWRHYECFEWCKKNYYVLS